MNNNYLNNQITRAQKVAQLELPFVTNLPVINKKTEIVICQLECHEISSDFYLSKKRFQEMLCLKYLVSKCLAHFFASKKMLASISTSACSA